MSAAVLDTVEFQDVQHDTLARVQARSLFESQRQARNALRWVDWERIVERFLQDVLTEATAGHWDRRAATFEAVGNLRCDATALECRNHAAVLRSMEFTDISAEVVDVLLEVV